MKTIANKGDCRLNSPHKNEFLFLLFFLCFTFFQSHIVLGQEPIGTFNIEAVTINSDWYVKLKIPSDINGSMDCFWGGNVYSWQAYLDGQPIGENPTNQWINPGFITPNLTTNGIDNSGAYSMRYYIKGNSGCWKYKTSNTIQVSTVPLKAPIHPTATNSTSREALENTIKITWDKGTDVPDGFHHYYIARDGDFENKIWIKGTESREWIDTNVNPGESHTYQIWTWVSSSTWGGHQSDTVTVDGSTYPQFVASDGTFFSKNQVKLSWQQTPATVTSIKIERDGVFLKTINDNNVTNYNDDGSDGDDVIPGVYYTYTLIFLDGENEISRQTDIGFALPNGRILGTVKPPSGGSGGIGEAIVYAERIKFADASVPDGAHQEIYSDTTNSAGDFEIKNIAYYKSADFKVYVEKGNHGFEPAFREVTLDLQSHIKNLPSPSFVDTSSFIIEGNIAQIFEKDSAAVEGVEIFVNDVFKGTKTDAEGNFSLTVEEIGDYTFAPRFLDHKFSPGERTYSIESDTSGIFFENIEKDTLSGYFLGGCDIYIGQANLRIFNTINQEAAFDTTITTEAGTGYYEIVLPSRAYTIEVTSFTKDETQSSLDEEDVKNFFESSNLDLSESAVKKDFIYRKPPEIEVLGFPEVGCAPPYDVPIVEQIIIYPLEIRVFESLGEEKCLTSAGFVVVYDEVKDGYQDADTLDLDGGIAQYELIPGEPNIISGGEHPFQKQIAFHANVDGQAVDLAKYVFVEGNKSYGQTFTTVTPEIPFLILRDPPGDESYSFMSENTSFSTSMSFSNQNSGSVNLWAKVKLGVESDVGVPGATTPFKLWGEIKGSLEVGASLKNQTEYLAELSTLNEFKTSDKQNITGEEGDVFIGSAMNLLYSLTFVVAFDQQSCKVDTSRQIIMAKEDFETTFMYTESHIRNVIIPQLEDIAKIYRENESQEIADSAFIYENRINVWQQTLADNDNLKERAQFIENRSFSAGAGFTSSSTLTTSATTSTEFSMYIEPSIAAEAGIEIAGAGYSNGVEVKYRFETGRSLSNAVTHSKTVGYYLNDDDIGDFFSVDIKSEPAYGTPVFDLVSGRSSCPMEPGTQSREGVQLTIDKRIQYDIEPDGEAVFKLNLGNTSQSEEDMTYDLVFLQESNPEGAVLTLGGSQVQGGVPTPYKIQAGKSIEQTVTVKRGPNANAYQDLKFVLSSQCDPDVINDAVSFSVYFKNNCSPVTISKPNTNWLINGMDNNQVQVEVSGYDKNNLTGIALQYKNVMKDYWVTAVTLSSADLSATSTFIDWDVSNIEDGTYEIRAKVACGETENTTEYNYSQILSGVIDRTPPIVFGVPEPADGTYEQDDEISVTFDESLNCAAIGISNVTLKEKSSGTTYPVGVGCNGNKLLIVPITDQTFTDQVLEVNVSEIADLHDNVISDAITWSFDIPNADFKIDESTDSDKDGIADLSDNCPYMANAEQADLDDDGIGDVCDDDIDGDGVENQLDNCPSFANGSQDDMDGDGIGDACDDDIDGDGVLNDDDNCRYTANPDQLDENNDGIGDACYTVTGLIEEMERFDVNVYPNPASNEVFISYNIQDAGLVAINLHDISGKMVKELVHESLDSGDHKSSISTSILKKGIYLLHIQMGGSSLTKKLLIMK